MRRGWGDARMSGNKDVFYDQKFYEGQRANSSASAHLVIPLVKDIVDPRSVLDVGCGVGTWINAWLQAGVEDAWESTATMSIAICSNALPISSLATI